MDEKLQLVRAEEINVQENEYENVFRRGMLETPKEKLLAKHRLWLATICHTSRIRSAFTYGFTIRHSTLTRCI